MQLGVKIKKNSVSQIFNLSLDISVSWNRSVVETVPMGPGFPEIAIGSGGEKKKDGKQNTNFFCYIIAFKTYRSLCRARNQQTIF